MNVVHLHLLLNHVPVIGAVFGVFLLGIALLRRSDELARLSMGLLTVLGVVSVAVFLTGDPAQEAIEKLPGFSETLVDRHEDAALLATIVTAIIGAGGLAAIVFYRRRAIPRWLTTLGLVCSLGATALMGYTANLGGQIRHTEIRRGSGLIESGAAIPSGSDERER